MPPDLRHSPATDVSERPLSATSKSPFIASIAFVVVPLFAGCAGLREWSNNGHKVGPNYQKPQAPVANEWIDSKTKGVSVATADLANWWTVFKDPVLNSLVQQAYSQNLSVRSAGTRILAARAQRVEALTRFARNAGYPRAIRTPAR